MLLFDKITKYATETPNQTAIFIGEQSLSYQQLHENVSVAYSQLQKLVSYQKAPKIALILDNSVSFVEYYLAATLYPHCCAVIDPKLPISQLEQIVTKLKPDLVVLHNDNQAVNELLKKLAIQVLHPSTANPDRNKYKIDSANQNYPFFIGFTSGTTSLPKAFIRSTHSWRKSFELSSAVFNLSDTQKILCPCPLSHGLALYCLNETLFSGKTFFSLSHWESQQCVDLIEKYQIDRLVSVPSILVSLNEKLAKTNKNITAIKSMITAGSKLDFKKYQMIRNRFPNATIQEYYGASELGFICVSELNDQNVQEHILSVGKAFPNVEIAILDESAKPKPQGKIGTIYVRSELVIDDYLWGDNLQDFKQNSPFFSVGDLGYLDEKGLLHVIGRKGDMILSGGFNIYLSEVENCLRNCPDITELCVLALDDNYLEHKLVAIVQSPQTSGQIFYNFCKKYLPNYKIPREFYKIDNFPMTSSGKISKNKLKQMILDKAPQVIKLSFISNR